MEDKTNSFYSRTDLMVLLLGLVLFLTAILVPLHLGFFTYSSDSRATFEHQGFQILDALVAGQLPLWDPYNANGREGTSLSVGFGAFAPDLLLGSWIVEKLLPNIGMAYKSFLVNLLFRYFFVFGIGLWFLGTVLFRSRTALYYFWFVALFGTSVLSPLSNQMLAQMLIYFPWVLFFLLKFVISKAFWSIIGLFLTLSAILIALSRDFPLLIFAVFVACSVSVVMFWPMLAKIRFSSFSKSQWAMVILALVVLLLLAVVVEDLGQVFLTSFVKYRFPMGKIMDVPLTAQLSPSEIHTGELLPDVTSLIFPHPTVTTHYGHYHPGHSYLFMGLCGFTLLLFSFSGPSRRFSYFLVALIGVYFLFAYWGALTVFSVLKGIIPGFKFYPYLFHLKYLILLLPVALGAIGLDNLILQPLKGKKAILISLGLLCLMNLALAGMYFKVIELTHPYAEDPLYRLIPALVILGTVAVIGTRCLQSFSLLKLMNGMEVKKWSIILIASETLIAIFFLFIGRGARLDQWDAIRTDPMYFLKYRASNFTLHAADPSGLRQDLWYETVYKVNFAKDHHLRMKGQANLYRNLKPLQKRALLGSGFPRLFLVEKIRLSSQEKLMDTLNKSVHPSIRQVPVIVDDGRLPRGLPLWQPGQIFLKPSNKTKFIQLDIPLSAMKVEKLPEREGWSKITVQGMGFSRHLSSNPYIIEQERLSCTLNGEELAGNWLLENLEDLPHAAFELNKNKPDLLKIATSVKKDEIKNLRLKFRDTNGIHVDAFGYNHLDLTYSAKKDSVLIYLDSYAEGWKANIDGRMAPIMCAYGAYKALLVPTGTHKVNFQYRPEKIITRWKFAFTSFFLLSILFIGSFSLKNCNLMK